MKFLHLLMPAVALGAAVVPRSEVTDAEADLTIPEVAEDVVVPPVAAAPAAPAPLEKPDECKDAIQCDCMTYEFTEWDCEEQTWKIVIDISAVSLLLLFIAVFC